MNITAAISIPEFEADRMTAGRARQIRPEPAACFVCDRSFSGGDGRFCSTRCRSAYDAGFPAYASQAVNYGMPMTRDGFAIACAGCSKTFSSKGLRRCSTDCERNYREREQNLATMAEAGIEPSVKRKCACGAVIPKWTATGRAVGTNQRFCSPRCQRKSRSGKSAAKPAFGTGNVQTSPLKPGFQIAGQNSLDFRIEPKRRLRTWGPALSPIEARVTGVSLDLDPEGEAA
jgi:hypothetical protein